MDVFFQPARDVAGDFYDVFSLHGKLMAFVVADVCDKGDSSSQSVKPLVLALV